MAMITGARNWIDVPAVLPATGGILDAARVIDTSDPHDLLGAEYLSDACAEGYVWDEFCTITPAAPKTFDDAYDLVTGDPFVVYTGVACDIQRLDEAAERARRRLAYTERHQVDEQVRLLLEATGSDLGTGPFGVPQGIGIGEAFATTVYGGVPTFVIPRVAVACACSGVGGIRTNLDGSLMTCQGSRVANIAGPPPFDADTMTMYVTGQITLIRGPVNTYSVPPMTDDVGVLHPPRALAERLYVPLVECLVAKIEVSCS
jgi:hypothetical protein